MPRTSRCAPVRCHCSCSRVTFFFSSRRRHTRLQGDWSSDVCSSDLINRTGQGAISVESINQGQSYAQSARVHSESSEVSPELLKLLESYLKAVQASQEIGRASCRERV